MTPPNEPPIALVTGASRGIGAAIARRLARDGCDIWLGYRSNHDAARETADAVEALGRRCTPLAFDVADEPAVEESLGPLLENATPEILVNNAGLARDALLMWMTAEEWQTVTDTTLRGFYNVTRRVLPGMLRRRSGAIVNIASTAGQAGLPGQTNYSAAKAGLIGATKSLAVEVAPRKIRVNAVAPGFIESDMTAELPRDEILGRIPLKRFGTPEDVAEAVAFLVSEAAAYITGHVLSVNGGLHV